MQCEKTISSAVLLLAMACTPKKPSAPPPTPSPPPAIEQPEPAEPADPIEALGKALCDGRIDDAHALLRPGTTREDLEAEWGTLVERWGECSKLATVSTAYDGTVQLLFFAFGNVLVPLRMLQADDGQPKSLRWMHWEPPSGFDTSTFEERIVTLPDDEWPLEAIATVPAEPKAWVVLVHGSGPHDRDSKMGPNRPFRDLAWGLAGHGIASLRYDKRTFVHANAMAEVPEGISVGNVVIDDAVRAAAAARELADGLPLVVAGHSLGGHLLPWIGREVPDADGLVFLAGNVSPLHRLALQQVKYLAELDGRISYTEKANIMVMGNLVETIDELDASSPRTDMTMGVPNGFWADLNAYDPVATLLELPQPALFIQAERDYQVDMAQLEKWKSGLGDRPATRYEVLPALNHLMMAGEGEPNPSEYQTPGHVDAKVIDVMADWIVGLGSR
ncbi:MAG: alpha/beta fold hydrolase [Myxococcota bacterium]